MEVGQSFRIVTPSQSTAAAGRQRPFTALRLQGRAKSVPLVRRQFHDQRWPLRRTHTGTSQPDRRCGSCGRPPGQVQDPLPIGGPHTVPEATMRNCRHRWALQRSGIEKTVLKARSPRPRSQERNLPSSSSSSHSLSRGRKLCNMPTAAPQRGRGTTTRSRTTSGMMLFSQLQHMNTASRPKDTRFLRIASLKKMYRDSWRRCSRSGPSGCGMVRWDDGPEVRPCS